MLNRIPFKKWMKSCLGTLRRHWLRAVAPATLVLTLAVSLLVSNVPTYARDLGKGVEMKNTYALVVSTGPSAGKQVEFFGITYEGQDGNKRTEYIFTHKGTDYPGDVQKNYLKVLSKVPNGNFFGKRQLDMRANTGYDLMDSINGSEILRPNTTDTIFFEPQTPIKTVTDISFFGSKNGEKLGQWTCRAMHVYQINQLYGFSPVGYFSSQRCVDFKGTLLAEADGLGDGKTFDWSTSDTMFHSVSGGYTIKNKFTTEEATYDTTKQKEYFFEVAFEDRYGAGIETLINANNTTTLTNMQVYGAAALEVRYTDIYGKIQKVSMPLIINAVDWAVSNGVPKSSVINGIAQQGESIGFSGVLPDCKIINGYRIAYGAEMAKTETRVSYISSSSLHQERVAQQTKAKQPDTVILDYVAVYDMSKTQITPTVEDGRLRYQKTGEPIRVDRRVLKQLLPGEYVERAFVDHTPGKRLDSKDYTHSYLVTVKTDEMPFAGTTSNVDMSFQYTDENGGAHWTDPYSLSKVSRDYYGQLSMLGTEDLYPYLMAPKHELKFIITLNDVARFTNLSIYMDNSNQDDWQMKSLEITKIDTLDARTFSMKSWTITDNTGKTAHGDRTAQRTSTGMSLVAMNNSVMLEPGKKVNISLEDSTVVPENEEEDAWSKEQHFEMSYEQAIKDMGMVKIRNTYQVAVNVADDLVTSTSDGDCGSKNLFYFQLVFKNGTSSYVLANQQLSADGFRAGVTEQFTISVNRSYGELVSINIIPDDETSDSQTYDKLKINSIAVSRNGTGGVNKQWMINDVGWVAIDYREEAEVQKDGITLPRTESDLVRNYLVDYTSYVINMQMCINTGEYKIDPVTKTKTPQFSGAVTAEIEYLNGAGEYRKQSFDVVRAMYNYAGKAPVFSEPVNGVKLFGDNAVSNPTLMFRENSTDRFIIGINDVSELISVQLQATGTKPTTWNVKSLSASLIESDGPLKLNAQNEYQRDNKIKEVASCTPAAGQNELSVINGQMTSKTLRFSPNKIIVKETGDNDWESTVSRVPDSLNDTLNVFLMPKDDGLDTTKYQVKCKVQYKSSFGMEYKTSERTMTKTKEEKSSLLTLTGIPVTNITSPTLLILNIDTSQTLNNFLDYAVIQQVRSNVVIASYFVKMDYTSTLLQQSYVIKDNIGMPQYAQFVDLKLGQDMPTAYLVKEGRDMAVSIQYTSQLVSGNAVLNSPYIFLTDQEYKAIAAGNTIRIAFNQPYVKNIVGISIAGTGGISVPVESATASAYTVEGDSRTCISWTNFFEPFKVDVKGTKLKGEIYEKEGSQVLQTLELTFADMLGNRVDTGVPKNPVRMGINYLNLDGEIVEKTYDEMSQHQMTKYLSNDDTNLPTTAVMLKDVSKIRYIYFEPYDDDDKTKNASWYIPCIYLNMGGPNKPLQCNDLVETKITEGERYYFNVANLSFDVTGQSYDEKTGIYTEVTANSEDIETEINLLAPSGQAVSLTAHSLNSKDEFITKVGRVLTAGVTPQEGLLSTNKGDISFSTPVNNTKDNEIYRVTISLKEMPQTSVVVNITVLPGGAKEPLPDDGTKPQTPVPTPPPVNDKADAGQQNQNPTDGNQPTP